MTKKLSMMILALWNVFTCVGQDQSFIVRLSQDTLYVGQNFRLEYEIQNLSGVFSPPEFTPFAIAGGPNTSSSFSMINGKVTQKMTYSYTLRATETGDFLLSGATVQSENEIFSSPELKICVKDNTFGKTTSPEFKSKKLEFKSDIQKGNSEEPKPKRKIRKI